MVDPVADIRRRFMPLLNEAQSALQRREEQYPPLVAAGKLDAGAAEQEIFVWRGIVADWRDVVEGGPAASIDRSTLSAKIDALAESVRRFNRALAKAIDAAPDAVRRDCIEDRPLWQLAERHGDAFDPILMVHYQRDRMAELLDWYRSELPGSGRWTIHEHLQINREARALGARERERRAAA